MEVSRKIYDRVGSAPVVPVATPPDRHFDRAGMDRADRRDERDAAKVTHSGISLVKWKKQM